MCYVILLEVQYYTNKTQREVMVLVMVEGNACALRIACMRECVHFACIACFAFSVL
jgi:hypothetical protein